MNAAEVLSPVATFIRRRVHRIQKLFEPPPEPMAWGIGGQHPSRRTQELRWQREPSCGARFCLSPSLPEPLESQVEQLLSSTFGAGSGKRPKKLWKVADQFCSLPLAYLVAVEDGGEEVVGCALLFRREVTHAGVPVLLGGVSGLTTLPRVRGRGIGTSLLRRVMGELNRQGCDAALLCTNLEDERLRRLYGRFGFVPLGKPYTYKGKWGRKYANDYGMVAPLCSESKFRLILESPEPLDIGLGNW